MVGSYQIDYKIGVVRFVETLTSAFNRLSRYFEMTEMVDESGVKYAHLHLTNCYIYDVNAKEYVSFFSINKYAAAETLKLKFDDGRDLTVDSSYEMFPLNREAPVQADKLLLRDVFHCEDKLYQKSKNSLSGLEISSGKRFTCYAVETMSGYYMVNGINVRHKEFC